MDKKVIFSGIQPTGNLHLGNYIGAIKPWVDSQDDQGIHIHCVVDLHAITVDQSPEELRQKTMDLTGLLIASGLDPEKIILFIQSHNPDHANLAWILNCFVSMGQMSRMTQFKEKSEGRESVSVGLFDYPALMAADILLYDTTQVPVGEDQKQHVELTRDIAQAFNKKYGDTFIIPSPVIPTVGGRVMSLSNPSKKMSKSAVDPNGTINLMDSKDEVLKKVMHSITDTKNKVTHSNDQPGISNLIEIYSNLTGKSIKEAEAQFSSSSYKEFKESVGEVVWSTLDKLQKNYKEVKASGELHKILKHGSERAYSVSHKKLEEVYDKIGFVR